MNNKQARDWHQMLDRLAKGETLSPQNVESLRELLPELPKQKTLEEIAWDMDFAWAETSGNDWKEELFGDLETWLSEQHTQLRAHLEGVKIQAHPALPVNMRLADHKNFGRVVVATDWNNHKGDHFCVFFNNRHGCVEYSYLSADHLTFVDAEPAKPAHPEFLETEADYQNAPEGTIVACEDSPPWHKFGSEWSSVLFWGTKDDRVMSRTIRRVLRWGNE